MEKDRAYLNEGRKVIDRGGTSEEPKRAHSMDLGIAERDTHRAFERFSPPLELEVPRMAQATIDAYEKVKWGVRKLMMKYSVKACGYCSEVHVGPWGHDLKLCGEFKHQGGMGSMGGRMQQWMRYSHQTMCGMLGIQKGLHTGSTQEVLWEGSGCG